METTRHFVATMYVVNDGATLLHEHEKLGMWLPPGGHIDRDEQPHEAALRETYEETGLDPELVAERGPYDTGQAESMPRPAAFLLEDIDVHEGGRVAHQHMDFVYFGRVESRAVEPAGHDETGADAWEWFTAEELDAHDELATDVRDLGMRAIESLS
ncbi:NUDIX hydrolase [Natronomonas amylolytica]|uniref:NUDIX hydrolase n=1 Tax=Natronomonas amylolytica TaxID=3108498 RepID=UPI00300B33D7